MDVWNDTDCNASFLAIGQSCWFRDLGVFANKEHNPVGYAKVFARLYSR